MHAWHRLFTQAQQEIGILSYGGLFLAEDPTTQRLLRDKARTGVRVRVALGDPDGEHTTQRGVEEGASDLLVARIRSSLRYCRQLVEEPGVELRLHDTTLYASIFRGDDELLVNTH